jgi:uncharacterized membrane protein YfcA
MIALWAFGALCAAAGIGGGGMIVGLLMFMGGLTPRDAVPVSKAVVFLGAIVSLALNAGRRASSSSKPLVDMVLVKLVVPMALLGTLIGVMTNEHTPGWGILVVLATIMVPIFFLVLRRAQQQFAEEKNAEKMKDVDEVQGLLDGVSTQVPASDSAEWSDVSPSKWSVNETQSMKWPPPPLSKQAACTWLDMMLLSLLLVIVISGGVLQHHVRACFEQHQKNGSSTFNSMDANILATGASVALSCKHPVLFVAFWGRAETWLAEKGFVSTMLMVLLAMPVWACFSTAFYYASLLMRQGWSRSTVTCYLSVGLVAGCLAGFVGIGGGLIFSPFFLLMGIDPSVAVATSSTCVVFTSSSTATQYFLMDRIHPQLAVLYGSVNALASFCGTAFVQHIGEKWAMKKSYITFIVAFGLAVSIAISSIKCSELIQMALRGLPT